MPRKTPLGRLPAETTADRRAIANALTTAAGQAKVRAWAAAIAESGRCVQGGQAKTISPALARRFWEAGAK